ncbi:MAG: hypothetical protein HY000_03590 [Planctomycetes bacterium]|nr:hypothetical protein [Planctomycetota bacterium]
MLNTAYKGIVKGSTVILEAGAALDEGTEVLVTPLTASPGSPQALLAAMTAEPHLKPEDVDELEQLIEEGKRPVSFTSAFRRKQTGGGQ